MRPEGKNVRGERSRLVRERAGSLRARRSVHLRRAETGSQDGVLFPSQEAHGERGIRTAFNGGVGTSQNGRRGSPSWGRTSLSGQNRSRPDEHCSTSCSGRGERPRSSVGRLFSRIAWFVEATGGVPTVRATGPEVPGQPSASPGGGRSATDCTSRSGRCIGKCRHDHPGKRVARPLNG